MYPEQPESENTPASTDDPVPYPTQDDRGAGADQSFQQILQELANTRLALQASQQAISKLQNDLLHTKEQAAVKPTSKERAALSEEAAGQLLMFRSAFDRTFVGMAVTDADGRFETANQAFYQISGTNYESLTSTTFQSLIHEADLEAFQQKWREFVNGRQQVLAAEFRYRRSNDAVWARSSITVIRDQQGNLANIVIISVDIHNEKRAQFKAEEITKNFRFLADSMPQQIWTADAAGNLNYFSHAFYEYSGMTFTDIKNYNWQKIVYPDDLERTEELWKLSLATGEEFQVEHRMKRRDGSFKWQLSMAMAQRDANDKILLWVGSTTNIHNHKTIEDQLEKQVQERTQDLREANFNLKHSNHDLEQFAYIATHDLQEPLRKIRTYSSWINKRYTEGLPEEARDYMIKIETASLRMSRLIDDLLNYSLLLRPQEVYENTDLDNILSDTLEDFDLLIKEKSVTIRAKSLPVIKAVPLQMKQLFHNIISNALKFTMDGRAPLVEISSRDLSVEEVISMHLDIDQSYVELVFRDNGIGFKQEYAERVFVIFQRLNNRSRYAGTGIGLALCQKIVLYHHGHIYANAVEGIGASFHVALPKLQA